MYAIPLQAHDTHLIASLLTIFSGMIVTVKMFFGRNNRHSNTESEPLKDSLQQKKPILSNSQHCT